MTPEPATRSLHVPRRTGAAPAAGQKMIDTARLHIREFEEPDLPALLTLVANPQVMGFSDGTESEIAARNPGWK